MRDVDCVLPRGEPPKRRRIVRPLERETETLRGVALPWRRADRLHNGSIVPRRLHEFLQISFRRLRLCSEEVFRFAPTACFVGSGTWLDVMAEGVEVVSVRGSISVAFSRSQSLTLGYWSFRGMRGSLLNRLDIVPGGTGNGEGAFSRYVRLDLEAGTFDGWLGSVYTGCPDLMYYCTFLGESGWRSENIYVIKFCNVKVSRCELFEEITQHSNYLNV